VKDVRKVVVPGPLFENEPEIQDYGVLSIMAKGSNRLKGAINVSGKHVLELKAMSDKASKPWRWVASTETIHLKEYKCFSKDSNGSLLNKTLVEDGLSSRALLDSGMKVFILLLTVVKLTRFWVKWR
jgi:hypothetical protein